MAADKDTKKTKRPTALKRDIQSEKRRLINKSFKSKVRSALNTFEDALNARDKSALSSALNVAYSLMDKGVKRGVYKINKANRTKSRLAAKVAKIA